MTDVLVIGYHAVSPTWTAALSVTPDMLERQLTGLVNRGWRGTTFRDAVLDPPAEKTLAVTFDDAFASVLTIAHPILSALQVPATVFAPTAFVSSSEPLTWPGIEHWDDGATASELTSMSWDELGGLAQDGWEVGSHTRTHPHLTTLEDDDLRDELESSRAEIVDHLGVCASIAYPYGDVDERVTEAARAAGYAVGAALPRRLARGTVHRWPRVGIYHVDNTWRFRLKTSRALRRARSSSLWPEH